MIYEFPKPDDPIRQGDIFRSIPRIDIDLGNLLVAESGDELFRQDWLQISASHDIVTGLVAMRPVTAIVITQDCDTIRVDDIALCEISEFKVVERSAKDISSTKSWVSMITKQARLNLKWFYLPIDDQLGFLQKMAVDFHSVLRTSRLYLEQNVQYLRIGRLNQIAREHFRERLSEYYRRYPYDEWYSLNKQEFEEYRKSKPEPIDPYPGQV